MMKKINRKKSTKTENKKQKRRIIKVVCLIVAVMITSAGMYLGFGIFKQVEGFSKEKLTSDESSVLCTTDGEEWFSVARGGVQKNVSQGTSEAASGQSSGNQPHVVGGRRRYRCCDRNPGSGS